METPYVRLIFVILFINFLAKIMTFYPAPQVESAEDGLVGLDVDKAVRGNSKAGPKYIQGKGCPKILLMSGSLILKHPVLHSI